MGRIRRNRFTRNEQSNEMRQSRIDEFVIKPVIFKETPEADWKMSRYVISKYINDFFYQLFSDVAPASTVSNSSFLFLILSQLSGKRTITSVKTLSNDEKECLGDEYLKYFDKIVSANDPQYAKDLIVYIQLIQRLLAHFTIQHNLEDAKKWYGMVRWFETAEQALKFGCSYNMALQHKGGGTLV